ncbi:hypothetical protein AC249_AIPGENE23928 [Paramuricea clavata]|uniref:Uncharacterized protein n=1 Tax=Paramuricea clavata TaxID=317549 RepID=A0A6S7J650_PARCT|nr:hypothetical protein AC249_AIPGENE23928 [Paramuricea clavata]
MVATKRCAWGTCKNDSRYPHLMVKNKNDHPVYFYRFPAPKRSPKKRSRWITACHRGDNFICSKDSYICSLHFVGQNGPTAENPYPISATASEQQVKRLERKRKPSARKNLEPTKKRRNMFEKDVAHSMLNLSDPIHLQTSHSTTSEHPKPVEDSVNALSIAEVLVTLANKVNSNHNPRKPKIDSSEQTLNTDVDGYFPETSPTKDKIVNSDDCESSTKENATQVTI